jgi:hypothetical protein
MTATSKIRRMDPRAGITSGLSSDAYQVDVVVALFSVLLILLLTSLAYVKSEPQRLSQTDYRPLDRRTSTFQLRSMAPIYPYRDVWIAREGMLIAVNLAGLSKHYMDSDSLRLEEWIPPVDLTIAPASSHIDSFHLKLAFSKGAIPGLMISEQVPISDADAALETLSRGRRGVLIYVWSDQGEGLAPILARLRHQGICYKLVLDPRRDTVAVDRDYALFSEEAVLRCY